MNARTFLLSVTVLILGQSASAVPLGDKNLENNWIQYHYKPPHGQDAEYMALDLRDSNAVISQVCHYADGTVLETSATVPVAIGVELGNEYFWIYHNVQATTSKNGHTCELEFPEGMVYYIADPPKYGGRLVLRILIKKWEKISDFIIRP